jgi:hypothetical protein
VDEVVTEKRAPFRLKPKEVKALALQNGEQLKIEKRRTWIGLKTNQQLRDVYLEALRTTGSYVRAAECAGINRRASLDLRDKDPGFREQCDEALYKYNEWLVEAARKRAVDGYTEPVVGGRNRDEIVAHKPVFSDRLMELLLKRHIPEFRDKSTVETTGTVLNVHASLNDLSNLGPQARKLLRQLIDTIDSDEKTLPAGDQSMPSTDPEADMPAEWK